MLGWLPRLVARIPATVHAKLMVAFLIIVGLLLVVGGVALRALSEVNERAEDLVQLQRKIAAYRQLQHDTTAQLYSVASALLVSDERSLDMILRQLNQFGYDLDRLQFVTRDEVELFGRVRAEYDEFIQVVTRAVRLIRAGRPAEGRELQQTQARPLADRLERLTNQLVNRAESDMVTSVDASHQAYVHARTIVIGFAVNSIGLALVLGFAISWSLIGPVKEMDARLRQIAAGDFSQRLLIPNRDELGTLAANLNQMNEELGRLYEQVETASRHKSEFLANMSHELRTPLNAIIGFSEVLGERMFGELNEKQDEYLKDIHASGQHLLSLINDILDLSKIEAGKMDLEVSDFDLPMAIDNALMLVRERTARKGIELQRSVDERLGGIQADERKLRQVLLNLLSNAIKFTPEGGRIEVGAKPVDGFIEVSVSDTGVGIAAEDQEAVFEEFRQVGTADKKVEGTGLGLALSRKFVELHGGKIWVKSQVGAGSTFMFTVPVRRGE
jgi:signal transduction histidine kinase